MEDIITLACGVCKRRNYTTVKNKKNDPDRIEKSATQQEQEGQWYVVHAYSGHEEKVKKNLEKRIESMDMQDKILQVLVPMEDEIEIKDGKRRHVQKRIFPGYILVRMVMSNESWFVVRNTPGVTSFVGSANSPVPLQEKEVRAIQKQMKQEAPKIRVEFQVGESVRLVDGPFTDFHGKVDEINPEKGKLKVLVNMFGRQTPFELDLLQAEKAHRPGIWKGMGRRKARTMWKLKWQAGRA